jgi:CheY-like chemotaxis protein
MNRLKGALVIDDDETTNFLHQRLLRKMEVCEQIRVFDNGKKAFDYLYNICNKNYEEENEDYFQPELILLDINMPVMGGFAFLDLYGKFEECFREGIMLALLTDSDDPQHAVLADNYGVNLLAKPLTRDKIAHLLSGRLDFPPELAA